jgi:nucleotide-binding universal stress UspA family protein
MYSHIVVPLDGSDNSERALPHAQNMGKGFSATLYLVQVVSRAEELDLMRDGVGSFAVAEYTRDVAQELINTRLARAEDYLKGVASGLEAQGISVKTTVLEGAAAENIIEYSQENNADLIIMSTRGQGGIQRLLVGSTTDRVIRSGHVPVLAIPPEDED